MLTEQEIDKIRASADRASLGYDTQDLAKRYTRDVGALLRERTTLVDLVNGGIAAADHQIQHIRRLEDQIEQMRHDIVGEVQVVQATGPTRE